MGEATKAERRSARERVSRYYETELANHTVRAAASRPETFELEAKRLAGPARVGGNRLEALDDRGRRLLWQPLQVTRSRSSDDQAQDRAFTRRARKGFSQNR